LWLCKFSNILFLAAAHSHDPPRTPGDFLRRGLAAPCSGRGNCPPKAVSEPPASVKCKPFHFVSTRKYQISLCAQIFIGTRCFLCTMTLVSIQRSTSPSNVQASNHLRIRQLLISSAESELSFRSQLCPGKWQEDSVIFSLLPLMSQRQLCPTKWQEDSVISSL
jgi:hypothetical protein